MYLLLLLAIFLVVGYLLADSRLGNKVDQATEGVTATSRSWADRLEDSVSGFFRRRKRAEDYRAWATESDSAFPNDYKVWLAGLTDDEAVAYYKTLAGYTRGLGYSLENLVDGGIDQDPMLRQVFVETIVVYSDAFRKARKALRDAQESKAKSADGRIASGDGKQPARKRASRRKQEPAAEVPEAASAA